VQTSSTATSGSLVGSHGYAPATSAAGVPGSDGVAHRTPVDLPTERRRGEWRAALALPLAVPIALAAGLLAVWLIVDPRTPDLAAAVYRLGLFRQLGFAVWDEHWYAGHHLPGYSLLFPPLASLLGLRLTCVLAVLASVVCFERLARRAYGSAARWGAAWLAVAAVADVWIGRVAFALGTAFALAAMLAFTSGRTARGLATRRRAARAPPTGRRAMDTRASAVLAPRAWTPLAGLLAAACAAASPVAGALLALAASTYSLWKRSPRAALVLAAPALAVVAAAALLFPEGGTEPFPIVSFAATVVVASAFLLALPRDQPLLRLGGCVYLLACVLSLLVRTPMGSNIQRYAVLLAGPLLLCAVLSDRGRGPIFGPPGAGVRPAPMAPLAGVRRAQLMAVAALWLIAAWVAWGPVRETGAVADSESTRASYYAPVERFIAAQTSAHGPVRVEVPLTRSHWETALLAPSVSLARGWEKQLDERYDAPLLARGLAASSYERWLRGQAVGYVALPDTPLDHSSAREGRLIRAGLPYLREVLATPHWRIYAVTGATPLLSGPGRLTSLGHGSFTLQADAPGRFLVRAHYSRYFTLVQGAGCVREAPGGWTFISTPKPAAVTVAARFSLSRALGLASACRGGAR
jgi:hypothetical protein